MAVQSIFQGHWRALEIVWLGEFRKTAKSESVAVITAGQPLTAHLLKLIPESLGGTAFFPGIPALSEALAVCVTGGQVPASRHIALACLAGYQPESAPAAAAFFEKLIESGVSAESFHVIAGSTKDLHEEVQRTALRFLKYSIRRNVLNPCSPDKTIAAGPQNPHRFKSYMFYGFYDLNPAQRAYVRQLSKTSEITWFSPVHPSHHWRQAFERTQNFLTELGCSETHRVDWEQPLSQNAQFAENLLTEKALLKNSGIKLYLCGSGSGFVKAVADQAAAMGEKYGNGEIAIVSTGDESRLLAKQLYAMNIPCSAPLTVSAATLPFGRLLSRLLQLGENCFHHSDVQKLLLTGAVTMKNAPDAAEYASRAAELGARFGLPALRATGFPFAEVMAEYFETLPRQADPSEYLRRTMTLLAELTDGSVPGQFTESVLRMKDFAVGEATTFEVFSRMAATALEAPIHLKEASTDGISIMPPEKVRGTLKKALILTGLEEGAFPRASVADPRLPLEVKRQLQLPLPEARETEEAFLLRQVFEAAEAEIAIICRHSDSSGRPLAMSPFLAPLLEKYSPIITETLSDSPSSVLFLPSNPPFLHSSISAQLERIGFDSENPSSGSTHCGMIGKGLFSVERISATLLENYSRDPFGFLFEKVWKLQEPSEFPVRSEPDPLFRGTLIHRCIEKCLQTDEQVFETVREICMASGLSEHLGSDTLAAIWMENLVPGIGQLKEMLAEMRWTFIASEISLTGTVAGLLASGRIDLVFKCPQGGYILADLKTGKPPSVTPGNIITNNRFQLPFYRALAVQNGYSPLTAAAYIYLESSGEVSVKSLSNSELEGINSQFEERVLQIVEAISAGVFPEGSERENRKSYP